MWILAALLGRNDGDITRERARERERKREGDIVPATERFLRHVGPHAARRPSPSVPRAVAATGATLVALGTTAWGWHLLVEEGARGPAVALAAGYAVAGLALLFLAGEPLRTTGVTAVAIGVPLFWGFAVLTRAGLSAQQPALALSLSTVTWGALALAGPARGHGALITATLAGAWLTVAARVGIDALVATPGLALGGSSRSASTAVALSSALFGLAYLLGGDALQRAGLRGTAVGFFATGGAAVAVAVVHAGAGRSGEAAGAILAGAGIAVAVIGAARRWLVWTGSAALGGGILLAVTGTFTSPTGRAAALVAAGCALVVVLALGRRRRESPRPALAPDTTPPSPTGAPPGTVPRTSSGRIGHLP